MDNNPISLYLYLYLSMSGCSPLTVVGAPITMNLS